MTKFIAKLFILGSQIALLFLNYWFAFGLWPKSWTAFILCALGQIGLFTMTILIDAEKA